MSPISFEPLYMERVWGGRKLESHFHRTLPDATSPFGEAWEIVDRDLEQSVVKGGPFSGKTLHELWVKHREELFGIGLPESERFPILIKILDARDDLSIQVHPPITKAKALGGEPKTEMWYIADAAPDATLYVGLKKGVTRAQFELAIKNQAVEACVHSIYPKVGESIFIPSGRLHAIGAGLLIYEIQQNSDTTYRVFDWNRPGLGGTLRTLHVAESLASINFDDFEPGMDLPQGDRLAECPHFRTSRKTLSAGEQIGNPQPDRFSILGIVAGSLTSADGLTYSKGEFLLLPKAGEKLIAAQASVVLQVELPL